jgi:hypothetical protein
MQLTNENKIFSYWSASRIKIFGAAALKMIAIKYKEVCSAVFLFTYRGNKKYEINISEVH